MRNVVAMAGKELRTYFASPVAYIVAAVFLLITGYFFTLGVINDQEATVRHFLTPGSFVLLLLSPALTMRLLAEEQKMGTLELLLTSPIRDWEVVAGKFMASLVILAAMLGLTIYYPILLYWFGNPDFGPIASGYLGLFLVGAAFLSAGLFTSSLTGNQVVAWVLGAGIVLLLWVIGGATQVVGGLFGEVIDYLSLPDHFRDFTLGVINTTDVVYFLSFMAVAFFLTIRSLETRRWR
ncbi:MAG: ABC transporter permease subunit [Chloroflexi bacterium]|nr:ABC transporter permease subunit [Chloroflexota bacterium]